MVFVDHSQCDLSILGDSAGLAALGALVDTNIVLIVPVVVAAHASTNPQASTAPPIPNTMTHREGSRGTGSAGRSWSISNNDLPQPRHTRRWMSRWVQDIMLSR